jgi:DNA-binding transcriptional LysR family regulator
MTNLRREIGSLTALFAFEAAGRLDSFTLAAAELGVTQAAVSKQISALEHELDTSLFRRMHRSVQLTEKGQELYQAVHDGLSGVVAAMQTLRIGTQPRPLTIAATMSMSHFWLLPRLPSFKKQHPDIAVRIVSQDEFLDLRSGTADMIIRFGDGSWPDGEDRMLFRGEICAMASPGFLASHGSIDTVEAILSCPLISYDTLDWSWEISTWTQWKKVGGVAGKLPAPALSFSRYIDAIQAASADQGVVLAWRSLTGGIEEKGQLLRLPGPPLVPRGAFYLVSTDKAEEQPECRAFRDWLVDQASAMPQP